MHRTSWPQSAAAGRICHTWFESCTSFKRCTQGGELPEDHRLVEQALQLAKEEQATYRYTRHRQWHGMQVCIYERHKGPLNCSGSI